MGDIVLRGGTVYDGSGTDPVTADVMIRGDRVVEVGRVDVPAGARVLDVSGLAVAPGFIDAHTHSDVVPFMSEPQPFKLLQGVTTEIVGNCGNSAGPLVDQDAVDFHRPMSSTIPAKVESWPRTLGGYLDAAAAAGPTNNIASLVGGSTLRISANGMDRDLREGALEQMVALADRAMAEGAVGMSTGLIYAPGSYASEAEVRALAEVVARWQRPYATHMRDEGDGLATSVASTIDLARTTGVRIQISHCKAAGAANFGRAHEILDAIHAARLEGLDVNGDMYPYTSGESFLSALLPSDAQSGGRGALVARLLDAEERERLRARVLAGGPGEGAWQQTTPAGVVVSMHDPDPSVLGHNLAEIAGARGMDPFDLLVELLIADPASMMVYDLMSLDDVELVLAEPSIAIGSDNSVPVGNAHRRGWGCFPTTLGEFARDRQIITLSEAIRKMTSLPARIFGLVGRGHLLPGAIADVAVFDPARIGHDGTTVEPWLAPTGLHHTFLAGHHVIDEGEFCGARRGRVLRAGFPEPEDQNR